MNEEGKKKLRHTERERSCCVYAVCEGASNPDDVGQHVVFGDKQYHLAVCHTFRKVHLKCKSPIAHCLSFHFISFNEISFAILSEKKFMAHTYTYRHLDLCWTDI